MGHAKSPKRYLIRGLRLSSRRPELAKLENTSLSCKLDNSGQSHRKSGILGNVGLENLARRIGAVGSCEIMEKVFDSGT